PDGNRIATAMSDGTGLVWDLTPTGCTQPRVPLTDKELDQLWADLAQEDAAKAYRAVWTLSALPAQVVPWLQKRLRPVPRVEPERITQWLQDLDHDDFQRRERAEQELARMGRQAEPAVRTALAANPSAEAQARLTRLLKPLDAWVLTDPDAL